MFGYNKRRNQYQTTRRGNGIGRLVLFLFLAVSLALPVSLAGPINRAKAASFDANNLLSDGDFKDVGGMSAGEIQRFLNQQGGFLKDYSENGRSAAQIIYDAAHGYGDASGTYSGIVIDSSTGTINPKAILVTLQKEQSLISMVTKSDGALRAAMGYGCPDSGGCSSSYAGFTTQIENAAWQLRYNFERATKYPNSDFQVGQTKTFTDFNGDHSVTFANKATAALYRYTPHVYNGNYNFWNMYVNTYNFQNPEYSFNYIGQSPHPQIIPGEANQFSLTIKNTGRVSWSPNTVRLGTDQGLDRVSSFMRESGSGSPQPSGWLSENRVGMQQRSVAPGETATFVFWMQAPTGLGSGTYREYFRPVADGITWMQDRGIYWDVKVLSPSEQYSYSYSGQSVHPTINRGDATQLTLNIVNSGKTTWTQNTVRLGTDREPDRTPLFLREPADASVNSGWTSPNRVKMQQSSVASGETATFIFYLKATSGMAPGTYREYFRPVADGITWMQDRGIYWDVKVN